MEKRGVSTGIYPIAPGSTPGAVCLGAGRRHALKQDLEPITNRCPVFGGMLQPENPI